MTRTGNYHQLRVCFGILFKETRAHWGISVPKMPAGSWWCLAASHCCPRRTCLPAAPSPASDLLVPIKHEL